jgi:hypothetical protein
MSHKAICTECSWTGDAKTLNGAARDAGDHREETGHEAKIERLITDGGRDRDEDLARIADALELQNALLLQLVQDRRRDATRNDPDPDRSAPSDHATATDVVDAYGDLYGGSVARWPFDPVSEQTDDMGDSK